MASALRTLLITDGFLRLNLPSGVLYDITGVTWTHGDHQLPSNQGLAGIGDHEQELYLDMLLKFDQ